MVGRARVISDHRTASLISRREAARTVPRSINGPAITKRIFQIAPYHDPSLYRVLLQGSLAKGPAAGPGISGVWAARHRWQGDSHYYIYTT